MKSIFQICDNKINLQPEKLNNQNFPEDMVGSFGDPYSSRIPFKKIDIMELD